SICLTSSLASRCRATPNKPMNADGQADAPRFAVTPREVPAGRRHGLLVVFLPELFSGTCPRVIGRSLGSRALVAMTDRNARDVLAAELRCLVIGRITSDEFDTATVRHP